MPKKVSSEPRTNTKKQTPKRLVLLDAHAIIHRAYHALPDFTTSRGEPTGALYGLVTMILRIASDLKPDYIVACYDLPQKTFRHEAYEDYKGTRTKTDDRLITQLEQSRQVIEALGIPIYDCPGFEADDMLGTIVEQLTKGKNRQNDLDIIIASGDMDTMQLIDGDRVQVFTLKKGITETVLFNEQAVLDRYGFTPALIADYKGLRGDPSDNIIGISGIGEKTATILITKFGSIESIYKSLKKDEQQFINAGITPRIIGLLKDGEEEAMFSKTLATIRRDAPISFNIPTEHWHGTVDKEKVQNLFSMLEFKSLIPKVLNLQNSLDDSGVSNSDIKSKENTIPKEDEDPDIILKTSIALSLLNSDITNPKREDVLNRTGVKSLVESLPILEKEIQQNGLSFVYEKIELPLAPVVRGMEQQGILIDKDYFAKLSGQYHAELEKFEKSIYTMAGREFNINSPKQLGEVLFDELKLQDKIQGVKLKKSQGGARSTRESELEKMRGADPIIEEILRYRELQKLLSTYIDVLPQLAGDDGRIHPHFNQLGASTGRFSSQNPNIQNMPIKTERGRAIRHGFVSAPGKVLMSFDYAQIELRLAALLSQDKELLEIFNNNEDVHTSVASRVFHVDIKDVTADMRRKAKVINFGILYGMGVNALKENLGTDRKEAQEFYDAYFSQFHQLATYLQAVIASAKKTGFAQTLFGRRRYFPLMNSSMPQMRAMAERMAINAPVQGTCADIIKISMVSIDKALKENNLTKEAKMLLQVHDELIFEVEEKSTSKIHDLVVNIMENSIPAEFTKGKKTVPISVGTALAKDWGSMK